MKILIAALVTLGLATAPVFAKSAETAQPSSHPEAGLGWG